MRFLSIDPGSIRTGFGLFEVSKELRLLKSGTIELPQETPLPLRLKELSEDLERIIQSQKPESLALERIFFSKNALSALQLGHARGVVLLKAAEYGLKIFEYTPAEIKLGVCGTGRASKEQIEKMVRLHLKLPKTFVMTSSDHSDALAIGLHHAQSLRFNALGKRGKVDRDCAFDR